MLNDEFADTNSVFASNISLRDDVLPSEQLVTDASSSGLFLQDGRTPGETSAAEELTLLPRKFLADPDNSSYEDLLLQIYGPDAGKLFA
jgi:hypothetical protein